MRNKLRRITVDEFTSPDPITVAPETSLPEILSLMKENNFRHIPVVEGKKAVGIISDRDVSLVRGLNLAAKLTAADVMTENPYCVTATTSLEEVCFALSSKKLGSAIVCDQAGDLQGIFTSTDALNAMVEVLRGDFS